MEECGRFGKVLEVRIPRPKKGSHENVAGLGKIFVRYENDTECTVALRALAGRKFSERTVLTSYLSEESFYAEDY